MGIWSLITGATAIDKTMAIAEKTTSGIITGLNKAFYTEQEKAENFNKRLEIFSKVADQNLEFIKASHSETTVRSITRRVVAIFIMILTFLAFVSIGFAYSIDPEYAQFLLDLSISFNIGVAFLSVVIFFFGNYLLNGIAGLRKK